VKANVDEIRALAAEYGRDPSQLKMFSGMTAIVGRTREEAEAKKADYQQYMSVEGIQAHYAGSSGYDLSRYGPDDYLEATATDHGQTAARRYTAPGSRRTVGQILKSMSTIGERMTFFAFGTPEEIADQMQYWMEETGLDGFNLTQYLTPHTFRDFIDLVIPELQRRGLFRTQYEPGTFRERLLGPGQARLPATHPAAQYRRAPTPA
jgi:alkanesulfonate monooxygenase SsuD/methylene tetrahydromethanopterin reductase-like flavin-dependent oxidoreductase (luciferase family)